MTDPAGAAIYGVPWILSIYPIYVSIFLPAPAGSYEILNIHWKPCFRCESKNMDWVVYLDGFNILGEAEY